MKKIICTWVYCPPVGKKYNHSQTGSDSDTAAVQALYWRCAACLFASSSLVHDQTDTRHILLCNVYPPEEIFGVNLPNFLQNHHVEVIKFSEVTCTPADYYEAWNTQFIVLDALRELLAVSGSSDVLFVLDSDCVFSQPISPEILQQVTQNKALLYTINYDRDYVVNGLTPEQMGEIECDIEGRNLRPEEPFLYQGGELICLRGDQIGVVERLGRRLLEVCLNRQNEGKQKYNEEAHLLSHVYRKLGYPSNSANEQQLIRRIWTDRGITRNIKGDESQLAIWHLPSEKRVGFRRFFSRASKMKVTHSSTMDQLFRIKESEYDRLVGNFRLLVKRIVRR